MDHFQYHAQGRKGLVMLSRFHVHVECIKIMRIFDKVINKVCAISASVGNELCHHGLLIQRFHMLRLAQSHVVHVNLLRVTRHFLPCA